MRKHIFGATNLGNARTSPGFCGVHNKQTTTETVGLGLGPGLDCLASSCSGCRVTCLRIKCLSVMQSCIIAQ